MRGINIGAQGFDEIRENSNFYVDKTSFIKEWWEDTAKQHRKGGAGDYN